MKTTFTLAALTGLLSAASAEYFSLTAARSASPIHYAPVTASGQQIWLNKDTASYCPDNVSSCPAGNTTVFAGGAGTIYDFSAGGRISRVLAFMASKLYGEGAAGMILSQMTDCESRSWVSGWSEEEYVA